MCAITQCLIKQSLEMVRLELLIWGIFAETKYTGQIQNDNHAIYMRLMKLNINSLTLSKLQLSHF